MAINHNPDLTILGAMSPKLAELFDEAWPLARMWFFAQRALVLPKDVKLAFCYDALNKVSRRWLARFSIMELTFAADLQRSLVLHFCCI